MGANRKINAVINWLLNDVPLINGDIKEKLLDKLNNVQLAFITDIKTNITRTEVDD